MIERPRDEMVRNLVAEGLGTALLLVGVVGSGIMADQLTDDIALALLANAIATGCILFVIITVLGPVSGAHFNPVVSLAFALRAQLRPGMAAAYCLVQVLGGVLGVWLSHVMFEMDILQLSTTHRTGSGQWVAEVLATFGLLCTIFGGLFSRPSAVPALVAIYITGAYWFTASTSFANPAVSIARALTDTFAGIAAADVPKFIVAQVVGLGISLPVIALLFSRK